MASVFGTDTGKPIVVKAGKAMLTVGGHTLIALDVQLSYQRAVEVIPTIGAKKVLSLGEPQGQMSANTVLAKGNDAFSAFKLGGDDCTPFDMSIKVMDGSCDLNGKTVTAKNCVASALSIAVQGGRGYVAQGVQVTFTALDM